MCQRSDLKLNQKKRVLYNRRHCVKLSNRKNFFEDQILAELKAHVCYYLISPVLSRITTMCCFTPRSIHYAIEFFFSFSFYCTIHTYTHPCTFAVVFALVSWSMRAPKLIIWNKFRNFLNVFQHKISFFVCIPCIFYVRMNWMRGYANTSAHDRGCDLWTRSLCHLSLLFEWKWTIYFACDLWTILRRKKIAAMRCMDAK